jgi:chorismate lyase/3-hydroxybenzoate synthase
MSLVSPVTRSDDDLPAGALAVRAWHPPDREDALALVTTTAAAQKLSHAAVLPLPSLGGTSRAEWWLSNTTPRRASPRPGLDIALAGELGFGMLTLAEGPDLAAAAECAYELLLEQMRAAGLTHLLRVWNYLDAINAGSGDGERYRQFCIGRARVIPDEPPTGYAAATAIGIPRARGKLVLHWLAARRAGVPIENPRQVSAWEYPRDYGPVAPGFSRAMLIEWTEPALLLVSGTASILGHRSTHSDVATQLDETLRNVEALIERAAARIGVAATLGVGTLLRAYVRRAEDAAAVTARLIARFGPRLPFLVLQGDICRRELLVEIEAVQRLGPG